MKKMVFIAGALMLIAGSAMAQGGTDLAWNDCLLAGGSPTRNVTCANLGSSLAHLTFTPTAALPALGATDAFLDLVTPNPIGSWWNTAVFTTRWGTSNTTGSCPEWWGGAPNGGLVFAPSGTIITPNRMRIRWGAVVAAGEERQIPADGTPFFCGALQLKFSTGTSGNQECIDGGAIGVYDLNLLQPGIPDTHLGQTPADGNCVKFQNAGGLVCPDATPTQKATWGSIKALYR